MTLSSLRRHYPEQVRAVGGSTALSARDPSSRVSPPTLATCRRPFRRRSFRPAPGATLEVLLAAIGDGSALRAEQMGPADRVAAGGLPRAHDSMTASTKRSSWRRLRHS